MNTTLIKSNKPLFKTNFQPVKEIRKAMRHNEGNLLYILDAIIHFMMVQESYENLKEGKKYLSKSVKMQAKRLFEDIEPIVKRDYEIVFFNGQETTLNIIAEFEILTRYIAIMKVPEKQMMQDMVTAFNNNTKLIGSISRKIVKSDNREKKELTPEQQEYLHLLDYAVNLVFLNKYLDVVKESHYNKLVFQQKINSLLKALKPLVMKDKGLVFTTIEETDLIEFYSNWISFLGKTKIDQKIVVSQLIESWNIDSKSFEGAVKKVLSNDKK